MNNDRLENKEDFRSQKVSTHNDEEEDMDCQGLEMRKAVAEVSLEATEKAILEMTLKKQFPDLLTISEASEVCSVPPESLAPAVTKATPVFLQKSRQLTGGLLAYTEHARRYDRAMQYAERQRCDRHTQAYLENAQNSLDNTEIIPLEKITPHEKDKSPHLPPSLEEVVFGVADTTGLSDAGIAMTLIVTFLIAVQGRVWIRIDASWREFAVSMILQSAPSGFCKTQLVAMLREPFEDFMRRKNAVYNKNCEESKLLQSIASQLAAATTKKRIRQQVSEMIDAEIPDISSIKGWLHRCAKEEKEIHALAPQLLAPCRVLVNKCTPARCLELLQENGGCLGCITDEADMLTSTILNPQKGIPTLVLHGYTGQYFNEENCRTKALFKQIAIPMIHIVQPHEAFLMYSDSRKVEQGLMPRLAPFFYDHSYPHKELKTQTIVKYNNKISALLEQFYTQDCNAKKFEVAIEESGVRVLKKFKKKVDSEIVSNMPSSARPYCAKAAGLAARWSFALHVWNCTDPLETKITKEEVEQACALVHETFSHARYAYASNGLAAFSDARKIVSSLLRVERREKRHLLRHGMNSRSIELRTGLKRQNINKSLRFLEWHNAIRIYDDFSESLKICFHRNFFNFFSQQNYD